jgi:chitinase
VVLVAGTGDDSGVTAAFASLAASEATRLRFAGELTALVNRYGYDGIDLDWEYPENGGDRANYTRLVVAVRTALGGGRSLSIAAPPTDWYGRWFDLAGFEPWLDWFGVMTYALSGAGWSGVAEHNAALYAGRPGADSLSATVAYYRSRGVPNRKLLPGLPFFGQRFDAATRLFQPLTSPSPGSSPDYKEIATLIGKGWTALRDATAQVPYLVRVGAPGLISYDDARSIAAKCSYIKAQGLGGAIIWSLGKDAVNGEQPLLAAVKGCR